MNYKLEDTIVSLSSVYGKSAIAVVRMSGKEAINILKQTAYSKDGKKIETFENRKTYYVTIKDKESAVDMLLVVVTHAPNTYTGQDMVELYPHGSVAVIERLINLMIRLGARAASNGEYTYRAYINGKIDMSEALAIHDLIESDNYRKAEASLYKMEGRLSKEVSEIKEALINTLIRIEGELDFPEDETVEFSYSELEKSFLLLKEKTEHILSVSNVVEKIMQGVRVAIIGKVNAGKSSIFNMIVGSEHAIVSDMAGTTRDSIRQCVYIEGTPYYITDTAGFNKNPENKVEQIGIERTIKNANEADVILAVFDGSENVTEDDKSVLDYLKNIKKHLIYILNKSDLGIKTDYGFEKYIKLSAKTGEGKKELISELQNIIKKEDIDIFTKETYINAEEKRYLSESLALIIKCIDETNAHSPLDIIAEETRILTSKINNIITPLETTDVINEIFSRFCIGK